MKHIAKRRARARRPFPICITPFRKGVANRRNTTASLRRLYHTTQKSQALPTGQCQDAGVKTSLLYMTNSKELEK